MTTLPYIPTWAFLSNDTVYILSSATANSGSFELLALDSRQGFNASSLPLTTISEALPFSSDVEKQAIIPAMDGQGNILVYTGNCEKEAQGSSLWRFTPTPKSHNRNRTWQELPFSVDENVANQDVLGASYLASAVAFPSSLNSTSGIYIYGGMCPNSTSSTVDSWTLDATYSNSMLTLEPSSLSSSSNRSFILSTASSRGAPIPEAGFSMTPLSPTFSNSSNPESKSQNQNFVLIGGHTQQAFINMSQIALFSLPEQTWSFIPVDSPESPQTDLTVRNFATVDPRSGHTSSLTPDGKKMIVIGGWVGKVSNAASPQLVVLEVGSDYGGNGDWQWSIPETSGAGIIEGTGLYGHGAVFIDNDVVLITGGYHISSASKQRRAETSPNGSSLLFNVTSNTWISSYTHPKATSPQGSQGETTNGANDAAKKAGLGVGVTFGILAIVIAIFFYLWYSRRLRRRREARDEELRNLAAGAHRFHLSDPIQPEPNVRREMSMVSSSEGDRLIGRNAHPWNSSHPPNSMRAHPALPEAERTGLLFEIPSPTRGLRRSLHSRAMYQPAPRYDEGRRGPVSSTIHPIDERDEYDETDGIERGGGEGETLQHREYNLLSNVPVLDPFRDPSDSSRTPSPQSPEQRQAELQGWVEDWTAADAMMHRGGRLSPERADRTSSTLSDQSARSLLSHSSMQQSVGTVSRTVSQRSGFMFSGNNLRPTTDGNQEEVLGASHHEGTGGSRHRRSRSLVLPTSSQRAVGHDPNTLVSSPFNRLQSEREALLSDYNGSGENSPTKLQRARGWMGSVRRALTGNDRSTSTSPENNASTASSPIKQKYGSEDLPRRAASTGGMYWQKRQGAKDWESRNSPEASGRPSGGDDGEEDWDVESAVEKRVVQVMFTVPREKLRVVNQGPDEDVDSIVDAPTNTEHDEDHDNKGKGKEVG